MENDDQEIVVLEEGQTMERLADEGVCCTGAKAAFGSTPAPKE